MGLITSGAAFVDRPRCLRRQDQLQPVMQSATEPQNAKHVLHKQEMNEITDEGPGGRRGHVDSRQVQRQARPMTNRTQRQAGLPCQKIVAVPAKPFYKSQCLCMLLTGPAALLLNQEASLLVLQFNRTTLLCEVGVT